jgi:hypothetical protein
VESLNPFPVGVAVYSNHAVGDEKGERLLLSTCLQRAAISLNVFEMKIRPEF